jgi:hypothetical protein
VSDGLGRQSVPFEIFYWWHRSPLLSWGTRDVLQVQNRGPLWGWLLSVSMQTQ